MNRFYIHAQLPIAATLSQPGACERRCQAGIPAIARYSAFAFLLHPSPSARHFDEPRSVMLTFTVVEISSVLDIVRPSNKFYRPMIRTSASVPDDLSPPAPYGATGMAPILVVPMMPYKKEIPTVAKAGGHFRTHTQKSYTKPRQVLSRRSSSPLDDSMTGALTFHCRSATAEPIRNTHGR